MAVDHQHPTTVPVPASPASIGEAARLLIAGHLVAFPTETVYGLGADAANPQAVAEIYRLKGRPSDHPLIVHAADLERARWWADWNERAERLAHAFWPGALTLILPRAAHAPDAACGGQPTIGLRVPSHPVASALLEAFHRLGGRGLAAPSANRFGRVSPTTAQHVIDDLGREAPLVLDGGACGVGLESTIVDLSRGHPALLRPGGIDAASIEAALGEPLRQAGAGAPRVSGSLAAHYAPTRPLELLPADQLASRVQVLGERGLRVICWSRVQPVPQPWRWSSMPADPIECGRQLFAQLREMDASGADCLLIEAPPVESRWLAVADRLRRAAVGAGAVP
jgi:L-threonylcarbamoyladenylate synthase